MDIVMDVKQQTMRLMYASYHVVPLRVGSLSEVPQDHPIEEAEALPPEDHKHEPLRRAGEPLRSFF